MGRVPACWKGDDLTLSTSQGVECARGATRSVTAALDHDEVDTVIRQGAVRVGLVGSPVDKAEWGPAGPGLHADPTPAGCSVGDGDGSIPSAARPARGPAQCGPRRTAPHHHQFHELGELPALASFPCYP